MCVCFGRGSRCGSANARRRHLDRWLLWAAAGCEPASAPSSSLESQIFSISICVSPETFVPSIFYSIQFGVCPPSYSISICTVCVSNGHCPYQTYFCHHQPQQLTPQRTQQPKHSTTIRRLPRRQQQQFKTSRQLRISEQQNRDSQATLIGSLFARPKTTTTTTILAAAASSTRPQQPL